MSDITKIREWIDSDEPEPEGGYEWPHPPICVESAVTGDLRARIIRRAGLQDTGQSVTLTELEIEGGWSEWTIEADYQIEVRIDGGEAWRYDYGWDAQQCMTEFLTWAGSDD